MRRLSSAGRTPLAVDLWLDCEVTLHANGYFKNEAVYDHSLAATGVVFAPGAVASNPAVDPVRHLFDAPRPVTLHQVSA